MTKLATKTAPEQPSPLKEKLHVLIVDDNADDSELMLDALRGGGFDPSAVIVASAEDFRLQLKRHNFEIILADYNLDSWCGMEALQILNQEKHDIPLILVSGALGDEMAVECIKQGAGDYILKDRLGRLPSAIHRALLERKLRHERIEAERVLADKIEELARSNRDLQQFAYVASHDLQEPLRMVSAYTQLLGERYKGKLDEQADKFIHYAVDGATRMQDLIQDLLLFSRLGRQDMSLQATDCNEVMRRAIRNLESAIAESAATIHCATLPVLMANSSQLEQVFQNILGNALKFRDGALPVIDVTAGQVGSDWVFSFADNGIGIAPEHAEVIFSIFQRLHTRGEYSGNGIGLAICKKIVEQHGGKIWLGNHHGPGCTVSFSIPSGKVGLNNQ